MSAVRIGRAFSPVNRLGNPTQGVALGWYGAGPLALGIRQAPRAKGASPYQPGESPQEWNPPTKQRAEGPIQRIAGYEAGHQFRGVTKMIPQQLPAAGLCQRTSSQGILDYSNRRRKRVAEEFSVVQTAGGNDLGLRGVGIGRAFSPLIHVRSEYLGRCPRLVWLWAFGPQNPTRATNRRRGLLPPHAPFFRANGASLYQPGATPQDKATETA